MYTLQRFSLSPEKIPLQTGWHRRFELFGGPATLLPDCGIVVVVVAGRSVASASGRAACGGHNHGGLLRRSRGTDLRVVASATSLPCSAVFASRRHLSWCGAGGGCAMRAASGGIICSSGVVGSLPPQHVTGNAHGLMLVISPRYGLLTGVPKSVSAGPVTSEGESENSGMLELLTFPSGARCTKPCPSDGVRATSDCCCG